MCRATLHRQCRRRECCTLLWIGPTVQRQKPGFQRQTLTQLYRSDRVTFFFLQFEGLVDVEMIEIVGNPLEGYTHYKVWLFLYA